MAFTTINKSTLHHNTKLFTGTGSNGNAITGVGFKPDLVWLKNRSGATAHVLVDALRGNNKVLNPDGTTAETTTNANKDFKSFDSDGFTVDTNENFGSTNTNGANIASWNWKGANSSGSANSDGSINSTVSANTTAGFSIVQFVGNSTSGATVGHGLGVAPKVVIIKSRDTAYSWRSYHASLGATKYIELDATGGYTTATNFMNDTAPTSSVFSLGNGDTPNKNGDNYIAYCFAEIKGYSKFGMYKGNSSLMGDSQHAPMIYTGFKPTTVIIKGTASSRDWYIWNNKNLGYNMENNELYPSDAGAEGTANKIGLMSNGFKLNHSGTGVNNNNEDYLYFAWGQSIVGSNNVPCTAR